MDRPFSYPVYGRMPDKTDRIHDNRKIRAFYFQISRIFYCTVLNQYPVYPFCRESNRGRGGGGCNTKSAVLPPDIFANILHGWFSSELWEGRRKSFSRLSVQNILGPASQKIMQCFCWQSHSGGTISEMLPKYLQENRIIWAFLSMQLKSLSQKAQQKMWIRIRKK